MAFTLSYIYKVLDQASAPMKKISSAFEMAHRQSRKLAIQLKRTSRAFNKFLGVTNESHRSLAKMASQAATLWATLKGIKAPIRDATALEAKMADLSRFMDFETPEAYDEMRNKIKKLAEEIPVTTLGIADMAIRGAQLKVLPEQMDDFIRQSAMAHVAWEMLPDAAGEAMKELSVIFNIPITQMGDLNDAINFFSNEMTVSGAEIVEMLKRVGSQMIALGLSKDQVIALAASFRKAGVPAEVAARAMSSMAMRLADLDKASDRAKAMMAALGLPVAEFSRLLEEDAQKAIRMLLGRIGKIKSGVQRVAVLGELFGQNFAKNINTLVGSLDTYDEALGLVGNTEKKAGSILREYQNQLGTTERQEILLANALFNTSATMGESVLPVYQQFINVGKKAVSIVGKLFSAVPPLSGALMGAMVAIGLYTGAILLANVVTNLLSGSIAIAKLITFGWIGALIGLFVVVPELRAVIVDLFSPLTDLWNSFDTGISLLDALKIAVKTGFKLFATYLRVILSPLFFVFKIIKAIVSLIGGASLSEAFSGLGKETAEFISKPWMKEGKPIDVAKPIEKAAEGKAKGEMTGKLDMELRLKGDTKAVESVGLKTSSTGDLGVNAQMAY